MRKIEWEWGYYGRCFVDGKFSHGVRIEIIGDGRFRGQKWDTCPEPGGTMLGVYDETTSIDKMMAQCECDANRLSVEEDGSMVDLQKKMSEYPYRKR